MYLLLTKTYFTKSTHETTTYQVLQRYLLPNEAVNTDKQYRQLLIQTNNTDNT